MDTTKTKESKSVIFNKNNIGIKYGSSWNFHFYSEICSVYIDCSYTVIKLENTKTYYTNIGIKYFENSLPETFIKCNRSAIINFSYLKTIENKKKNLFITLINGDEYSISRSCKKKFSSPNLYLKDIEYPCDKCLYCTKKSKCKIL